MRLPFRKKDKKRQESGSFIPDEFRPDGAFVKPFAPPTWHSAQLLEHVPPQILQRIFTLVCPHAKDESYQSADASVRNTGCMLCDLRDLSNCTQVCRRWRHAAVPVLYHSVRIDPVHYCKLEEFLADRREKKRSSARGSNSPEDPALARLRLFRRTVRDDPTRIGKSVRYLKLTYMLRESAQVELAQTLAVLPALQYVDLPEGLFSDEPSYSTLRLEVQARCPDIRKMTYNAGAEGSVELLATRQIWTNIEVLELHRLDMDPRALKAAVAALSRLKALKITETDSFTDEVLIDDGYEPLPPLEELVLKDTGRVTATGILHYLAAPGRQRALKVLALHNTNVKVHHLQDILAAATCLETLALQATVTEPLHGEYEAHPLSSQSLTTLRYEISAAKSRAAWTSVTASYYTYLASSIRLNGLPGLQRLYVEDETIPEQLQGLPPPNAAFANGQMRPSSRGSPGPAVPNIQVTPATQAPGLAAGSHLSPLSPPQRRPISKVPPTNRFSSNNPFASSSPFGASGSSGSSAFPAIQKLEIFTKRQDTAQWDFFRIETSLAPAAATASRSAGTSERPVSSYGLGEDVQGLGWNSAGARRSVMVGNGTTGFLELERQGAERTTGAASGLGRGGSRGTGSGATLDTGLSEAEALWPTRRSSADERGSKDLWR